MTLEQGESEVHTVGAGFRLDQTDSQAWACVRWGGCILGWAWMGVCVHVEWVCVR